MHPSFYDVCHLESRFGQFRNSVSFGARYVQGLRLMHHSLRNHFESTCWYFGEEAQVEARFDLFGDSATLDASGSTCWYFGEEALVEAWFVQFGDSANAWFASNMPYAWKSIWMHPMELLDDVCHMKSRFGPFGDIVSFGAR